MVFAFILQKVYFSGCIAADDFVPVLGRSPMDPPLAARAGVDRISAPK